MATEILATASTAANSADTAVASGETLTVCLKGVTDASARVLIYLKDDDSAYNLVGELNSYKPSTVIAAIGTYRFTRVAGGACGVFSG